MRKLAILLCLALSVPIFAAKTTTTKQKTTTKKAAKSTKTTAKKKPPAEHVAFTPEDGTPIAHTAGEKRRGPANVYPNSDTNPGALRAEVTQDNIAKTICNKAVTTGTIRPPASYTTGLKKKQLPDYGFTKHQAGIGMDHDKCIPDSDNLGCYEEDHIVSLENGGAPSDPKNLYPEAYNTKIKGETVGAHEKDKVENYVHNGICLDVANAKFSAGPKPKKSLTLEDGQRILAIDWYACYLSLSSSKDCVPPPK